MSTLCALQNVHPQTLFLVAHNFQQKMQQELAGDQIHNNSVSGDRQFLQTVKLSIKSVALEFAKSSEQGRVRQFYEDGRPQNVEIYANIQRLIQSRGSPRKIVKTHRDEG